MLFVLDVVLDGFAFATHRAAPRVVAKSGSCFQGADRVSQSPGKPLHSTSNSGRDAVDDLKLTK